MQFVFISVLKASVCYRNTTLNALQVAIERRAFERTRILTHFTLRLGVLDNEG